MLEELVQREFRDPLPEEILRAERDAEENAVEMVLLARDHERQWPEIEAGEWKRWVKQWIRQEGGRERARVRYTQFQPQPAVDLDEVMRMDFRYASALAAVNLQVPFPDEEEARAHFAAHPDRFQMPTGVRVRHLAVSSPRPSPAIEMELLNLRELLLKGGASITQLAETLGPEYVEQVRLPLVLTAQHARGNAADFVRAALALRPGEVSPPVQGPAGKIHLIQCEAALPGGPLAWEAARELARHDLHRDRQAAAVDAHLDTLRAAATLTRA
jgi:hypothetical protein